MISLVLFAFISSLLVPTIGADLDVKLKTGNISWYINNPRFRAPVPITESSNALKNASTFGNACPQPPSNLGAPISEDCLFLNVFRPQNTAANAGLPVLVWIHGGQYTTGAASEPGDEPNRMLRRSVDIGKPIILVSINYRLNTFGFLASSLMDHKT
ncbi:hypothetical protein MPER_06994 [Moniliophthora perniciosa FA553]|nr:hypothetical protein MPER_06994 [Moniliophthora perniciosa FA553]